MQQLTTDNTLLNLFKEQLGNQINKLVTSYTLENDGQGLIWWYFINFHGMNKTEVEEVFCDGFGDLGIDAIFINETSRVHFYQLRIRKRWLQDFQQVTLTRCYQVWQSLWLKSMHPWQI